MIYLTPPVKISLRQKSNRTDFHILARNNYALFDIFLQVDEECDAFYAEIIINRLVHNTKRSSRESFHTNVFQIRVDNQRYIELNKWILFVQGFRFRKTRSILSSHSIQP